MVDGIVLDAFSQHIEEIAVETKESEPSTASSKIGGRALSKREEREKEQEKLEDLNERIRLGIMNSYEKSKQDFENQKKNQEGLSKDQLAKRLADRKEKPVGSSLTNATASEVLWDDQTEILLEGMMENLLVSDTPATSSQSSQIAPTAVKVIDNYGSSYAASHNDGAGPKSSKPYPVPSAIATASIVDTEDKDRIKNMYNEKEKELVCSPFLLLTFYISCPYFYLLTLLFPVVIWITCIRICSTRRRS